MAVQTSTRLTYDDYVTLPDDGKRYEIIDGELYVNPACTLRHQRALLNVGVALHVYFKTGGGGGGETLLGPIDVVFSDDNIVQPDLIVIKTERAALVGKKNVQGAPNLVVEVVSDRTRRVDERLKRKLYDRFGVDEYWIVDPELELVKIHRRTATAFERVAEIGTEEGGAITTPLLPGFSLDVGDVFAS